MNGPFDLKNYKNLKKIAPFLKDGMIKPPRQRMNLLDLTRDFKTVSNNAPRRPVTMTNNRRQFNKNIYDDSSTTYSDSSDSDDW